MSAPEDMAAFNRGVIEQYRASGGIGEIGPVHFDRLCLLTTTGRRSGEARTVPLGFARDGADVVLFASNMGAPSDPDWCRNLRSDPAVTVEIGAERLEGTATVPDGTERDRLYRLWLAEFPDTAGHEEQTERTIPLVRIRPA